MLHKFAQCINFRSLLTKTSLSVVLIEVALIKANLSVVLIKTALIKNLPVRCLD